eukprot:CAMPEP_0179100016 /NCGR_PEP_ID=MMETSP0796-20121207/46166_1 /TAXON_ID=73915 /ORGANISM="Pyrodinium bahamense, Strain pbaha01" /LENGTH=574 /DNA_ID=CAMNT_0020797821 /DNA_START=54 /DNA_END=1778 /DNA_ORIENTATION=+
MAGSGGLRSYPEAIWWVCGALLVFICTEERPTTGTGRLVAVVILFVCKGLYAVVIASVSNFPFVQGALGRLSCLQERHIAFSYCVMFLFTLVVMPALCAVWAVIAAAPLAVFDGSQGFVKAFKVALGCLVRCWALDSRSMRPKGLLAKAWHTLVACNSLVMCQGFTLGLMHWGKIAKALARKAENKAIDYKGYICRHGIPFIMLQCMFIPLLLAVVIAFSAPVMMWLAEWESIGDSVIYVSGSMSLMPAESTTVPETTAGIWWDLGTSCIGITASSLCISTISHLPFTKALTQAIGGHRRGLIPAIKVFVLVFMVIVPMQFILMAMFMTPLVAVVEESNNMPVIFAGILDTMLAYPGTLIKPEQSVKTFAGKLCHFLCEAWGHTFCTGTGVGIVYNSAGLEELVHLLSRVMLEDIGVEDLGIKRPDGRVFLPDGKYRIQDPAGPQNPVCPCIPGSRDVSDSDSEDEERWDRDARSRAFVGCYLNLSSVLTDWEKWELSDTDALLHANYYIAKIKSLGRIDSDYCREMLVQEGISDEHREHIEGIYDQLLEHCNPRQYSDSPLTGPVSRLFVCLQ